VAAVDLLVAHVVWLRRNDFVDGFVRAVDEPAAGEATLAWVDWRAAVRVLEAGRLPCSGSEAGVLRVAASIAEGIPVDLGEALTGLDERNLMLVAEAVLRVGGSIAPVGAGAGGGDRR
jgi:hypothetical protein